MLSQDDKAKVPLGIAAAKLQSPMLMHVEYDRVRLPDHDFAVGTRHKLTPSVYAGLVIKKDGMGKPEAVTYSGPTYIAIRSAKHSSSTATTHAKDISTLLRQEDFKALAIGQNGKVKPVLMVLADGGPDENPRYKKVIAHAITHFIDHDLDAAFVATNAPGRSCFNPVERRMSHLSKALAALILDYMTHGSHLDSSGKTIDVELEKKNFQTAG